MDVVALVTWVITAGLGFTMLAMWVRRGGLRAAQAGGGAVTRFPPALVFGHFLLAAAGLVVWIVYLISPSGTLAWVAFAVLVAVAIGGDVLFLRWWRERRGDTVEARFPTGVVYAHGLFAVATVILVLLVALGVG